MEQAEVSSDREPRKTWKFSREVCPAGSVVYFEVGGDSGVRVMFIFIKIEFS